jgi:hypothetical protein
MMRNLCIIMKRDLLSVAIVFAFCIGTVHAAEAPINDWVDDSAALYKRATAMRGGNFMFTKEQFFEAAGRLTTRLRNCYYRGVAQHAQSNLILACGTPDDNLDDAEVYLKVVTSALGQRTVP